MKILLIGGTGLTGSYLLPLLRDSNHDVIALTRSSGKIDLIEKMGAHALAGDIRKPETFSGSISGIDIIVMLAMPGVKPGRRINRKRKEELRAETNDFFRNTMELAVRYDVPVILPGGTSFKTAGDEVADETWPIYRKGLTEVGCDTDEMIRDAVEHEKPRIVQLMFGKIYGNGGLFRFSYEMMKRRPMVIGSGKNYIPNIHAADAAAAVMKAIEKLPVGEKFIIADDTPVSQWEFNCRMAELMGLGKPGKVPEFILRLVLGKEMLEVITMDCKVSNTKAKQLLGWNPQYPSSLSALEPLLKEMAVNKPYFS